MKKLILTTMTLMTFLLMSSPVFASGLDGWVETRKDNWNYFKDGEKVESTWVQSKESGRWYFFDEDGEMVTSSFINNTEKIAEEEPSSYNDEYFYVGSDGAMVTDWYDINCDKTQQHPADVIEDNWYYFGKNGKMVRESWIQSPYSLLWYAVDEDGRMFKNAIVPNDIEKETGALYYVNSDGAMITGWYKTTENDVLFEKDQWIYAGTDGKLTKEGWSKINGDWFYFGEKDATIVTSDREITTGSAITLDYQMIASAFIQENGYTFFLDKDGYLQTGVQKFKDANGEYYLYFEETGILQEGSSSLNDGEYNIIRTFDKDNIAIGNDSRVLVKGYAYTDSKDGKEFKIVERVKDIPEGSYYYKLGTSSSLVKR